MGGGEGGVGGGRGKEREGEEGGRDGGRESRILPTNLAPSCIHFTASEERLLRGPLHDLQEKTRSTPCLTIRIQGTPQVMGRVSRSQRGIHHTT